MKCFIIAVLCVAAVYGKAVRQLEPFDESLVIQEFVERYGQDSFQMLRATLEEFLEERLPKVETTMEDVIIDTTAMMTTEMYPTEEATTGSEDSTDSDRSYTTDSVRSYTAEERQIDEETTEMDFIEVTTAAIEIDEEGTATSETESEEATTTEETEEVPEETTPAEDEEVTTKDNEMTTGAEEEATTYDDSTANPV